MGRIVLASMDRGDRLPVFTLRVSADEVRAYLEATGEPCARWSAHVPPLALGALSLAGLMERVQTPGGAVHTGQDYEFRRLIAHDEAVEVSFEIASKAERRGSTIFAFDCRWSVGGAPAGGGRTTIIVAPDAMPGA